MTIEKNKKMLLFRYNNYAKTNFIEEHKKVISENGYVWMLKIGKKSSMDKLKKIIDDGGWMVLRAPKSDGSVSYLARIKEIQDSMPDETVYPDYYDYIIWENENFDYDFSSEQWFKLDLIRPLSEDFSDCLILENNKKKVNEVIGTTRTAVMFVTNTKIIEI